MHQPTVHPKPYTLYPAGQLLVQHPYLWPASGVAGRLADRACAPADSLGAVQGRGPAEEVEAGGTHAMPRPYWYPYWDGGPTGDPVGRCPTCDWLCI